MTKEATRTKTRTERTRTASHHYTEQQVNLYECECVASVALRGVLCCNGIIFCVYNSVFWAILFLREEERETINKEI